MQNRAYRASDISRHAFENLVALWLTIVCLTFAAALLLSATAAKADILLPLPEPDKVFDPAVLQSFSPSPAPALVDERCQSYLHPLHTGNAPHTTASVSQRNAGTSSVQFVSAIKSYRHCVSQIVLEQLAKK